MTDSTPTTARTTTGMVRAHALADFRRAVAKYQKRCERLGGGFMTVEIGPKRDDKRRTASGYDYTVEVHDVTMHWEPAVVGGWEFVAKIDHMGSAGCVVNPVPGYKPARKWAKATDWCDHCNTANRGRLTTYLLRRVGSTRVIKQVGKSCVRKYIGLSPREAFNQLDYQRELLGYMGDGEPGFGYRPKGWTLTRYLPHVAAVIRECGWVSKGKAADDDLLEPTCERASYNCEPPLKLDPTKPLIRVTDEDTALAMAALKWAAGVAPRNDYLQNIKVLARADFALFKHFGFAASIVSSYQRHLDREAERKRRDSERVSMHLGEPGERLTREVVLTFRRVTVGGAYGPTTLHKFRDVETGAELTWFASGRPVGELGETIRITATVKRHGEYRGVKSTTINRVKVAA